MATTQDRQTTRPMLSKSYIICIQRYSTHKSHSRSEQLDEDVLLFASGTKNRALWNSGPVRLCDLNGRNLIIYLSEVSNVTELFDKHAPMVGEYKREHDIPLVSLCVAIYVTQCS